jgi:hypothetical protein
LLTVASLYNTWKKLDLAQAMPKDSHAFLGWTKAIYDKSFFIFRASLPFGGAEQKK